jgi:Ku protein
MAARSAWAGALTLAGLPVNVKLYGRTKSRSGESFKTLAPTNQLPIQQQLVDSDGNVVERADCLKGVEVSKGSFHALPEEAVEMIGSAERSVMLEPEQFCPLATVPLHLTTAAYAVAPNDKVPGSEQAVGIVWNGLRAAELGYVSQIVVRAGSRDSILVVWADDEGLHANGLPYASELHPAPAWKPVEDEQAAQTFEAFVTSAYADRMAEFDHEQYTSSYAERRAEAVQAALAGEKIAVPEVAKAQAAAPDLLAAMQASIKQAKTPAPKVKPKAAKKEKAKA